MIVIVWTHGARTPVLCMSSSRLQFTSQPKGPVMRRNFWFLHMVLLRLEEVKSPGRIVKWFTDVFPAVFKELLEQIQASSLVVPCLRPVCSPDRVTVFQLSVYLQRWGIQDLGPHISRLAREGTKKIFSACC